MKFGLVAGRDISKAGELAQKIGEFIQSSGQEIVSHKNLQNADLVLVLGGDGTLIHTACERVELNIPFVGINAGTLGFLTAVEESDWQEAVKKLIEGQYIVSERMILEASLVQSSKFKVQSYRALNEVVVKGIYRVVDLEITVNGKKFLSIVGDGVIVSTQTGSTAYSLSSGGPIVDPSVDCFLITPVNAVGLPIPSIALSPEDMVEIKIKKGDDISLIIDGQEHTKVVVDQSIRVFKGKHRVKFGYFDKDYFLKALNAKFGLANRLVG